MYHKVPVCKEHYPQSTVNAKNSDYNPVGDKEPETPRVGSLFGPFGWAEQ